MAAVVRDAWPFAVDTPIPHVQGIWGPLPYRSSALALAYDYLDGQAHRDEGYRQICVFDDAYVSPGVVWVLDTSDRFCDEYGCYAHTEDISSSPFVVPHDYPVANRPLQQQWSGSL